MWVVPVAGAVAALQAAVERLGKAHDFRELAAGRQEPNEFRRYDRDGSDSKTQQEWCKKEMLIGDAIGDVGDALLSGN